MALLYCGNTFIFKRRESGDDSDDRLYVVCYQQGFTGELKKQPEFTPARKPNKRIVIVSTCYTA